MSKYRNRLGKPHIAIGAHSRLWFVVNCLNFTVDNKAYIDACLFTFLRNTSEGRMSWLTNTQS